MHTANCFKPRTFLKQTNANEILPCQHHIIVVIFAPFPVFSGIHSKVQRQHLMIRVCQRDHHCGGFYQTKGNK